MEINYINKLGRKHYICKEEHLKSESSLESLENIVTKRREERVKLQKTQYQALDCDGSRQRRLRERERERERDMKTFVANSLGLEEVGG